MNDLDLSISMPSFSNLKFQERLKILTQLHIKITERIKIKELDISIIEHLPLHVQFQIISEGILIYENSSGKNVSFIEELFPLYYDHIISYKRLLKESKYITQKKGKIL